MHLLPRALVRATALSLAAAWLSGPAAAQMEAPPSVQLPYAYASEAASNEGSAPAVIISFQVVVQDTPWMRLSFSDVQLSGDPVMGTGSLLRMTSLYDGAVQELNATHVAQWQNGSAYFNGDAVLVEVLAQPGTGTNRVVLDSVTAGEIPSGDSQCGSTDDRVLSDDPRTGRILPIGCTGWIIDDCASCFLTAGHCSGGTQVVEFQVPLSTTSGSIVNSSPDDQYAVDPASVQSNGGQGVGNDWAYFGVFPNPNTGLTPFEAQGARHTLALAPPLSSGGGIRITGYGVDSSPPQYNQVQQTDLGRWVTSTSTTVQYVTDTEGGNSGSPIQHEGTHTAIGIHTHGGCNTNGTGQNSGTALSHPGLLAALANPTGICATGGPCGPIGKSYCSSNGAAMGALGTSSVVDDELTLTASGLPADKHGIFIYAMTAQSVPFGQGTMCVGPSQVFRLSPLLDSGAAGELSYDVDYGALPAGGPIQAGDTVYFQSWFRSGPGTFDLSDGLAITFRP